MAKRQREPESGGEASPGHHAGRVYAPSSEQLPCLVVRSTPDGFVVGRALVDASAVTWLSPTHVRPWLETRPTDVRIPALVQGNIGGNTELKPARTAKGVPVATPVAWEVLFGEAHDTSSKRAHDELGRQIRATWNGRPTWWRHNCPKKLRSGLTGTEPTLPERVATRTGEPCAHCRATEGGKKASAA